jgi:hypothetical protein
MILSLGSKYKRELNVLELFYLYLYRKCKLASQPFPSTPPILFHRVCQQILCRELNLDLSLFHRTSQSDWRIYLEYFAFYIFTDTIVGNCNFNLVRVYSCKTAILPPSFVNFSALVIRFRKIVTYPYRHKLLFLQNRSSLTICFQLLLN